MKSPSLLRKTEAILRPKKTIFQKSIPSATKRTQNVGTLPHIIIPFEIRKSSTSKK